VAESLLELTDVVVRHGDKVALQIPRLKILPGEVLGVLGPNGAGKTTLLRVMGLLQTPDTGSIQFDGIPVRPVNALAIRRRIAMVFQEPLLLNSSTYQNAALGLKLRGLRGGEIADRLAPWLERLGIASLAARSARTLSGGEAQRTSLARALVLEPELLLLDEPFAALDPGSRGALLRDFQRIVKEARVTTVFVTHDREEAFALADKVIVLKDGLPLQFGRYDEVFFRPNSAASAEICGIANRLAGTIEAHDGEFAVARVDQLRLRTTVKFPAGAKVILCIRPENVLLSRDHRSARNFNQLTGKIISILPGIAHYRITLDCSAIQLVALAERRALLEAGHREGDMVTAVFSPSSVHAIEDESTQRGETGS
jgi:tungstate transport system ATP-binding protein